MKRHRRTLLAALALSPLLARAQRSPGGEGVAYTTLRKQLPVETPGKIEVVEFFWYGCIHCYHFEPLLEAWVPKLKPDTQFRRVPAVFDDPRFVHDAGIFYAFEAMGLLEKLHRPLFDEIHVNRMRTNNRDAFFAWLGKNGVDTKKFESTMSSFGVQTKVKRAAQLTAGAAIDGTPALAVQGRWTISAEQGPTQEGMLATASRLIDVARREGAK
ncbi:MAG TPA: thiol:disulfide interchange protein DsbA/DsbL [Burkholderiales bacterium]|nr:thiol:disulfide interchange protein DsbA/DsbL [Burkholderiales bacterium]